jgi:PKD domain
VGIYKLVILVGLLVILPAVSHAQVSKIVFTTEPQTVKPSEISGTITIQLQDSAGSSYQATETVDVEFLSSSISGEFLSPSSENAVTKTISTGSANKNFRYRDSTNGTFTLTVKATGRTSGGIWNANQVIIISNSVPTSTTTATTTATTKDMTTASVPSSNQESSSSGLSSSHYSAAALSSLKISPGFEVSAGRDRLGIVGSPLEFKVETNIEYTNNSIFVWNFGDGAEGVGEIVNHTYTYPGEYILILNVSSPRGKAVSRVNVKVVSPELVITHISKERIELTNNSKSEVSLFGRALVTGNKIFTFPRDTILKAGQKISFSTNVTGLAPSEQSEVSLMVVGTEIKPQEIMAKIEEQKLEKIAYVRNEISILQKQLADVSSRQNIAKSTEVITGPTNDESNTESQTALVIEAVAPETDTSMIKNWFQTLKRFFFRTQ